MTTHEAFSHLLGLMARQADYMRLMVAVQDRQRLALVQFTPNDLQIATDEQSRLSNNLRILEKERLEFVSTLFQCSPKHASELSSSMIAEHCPNDMKDAFLSLRDEMKNLMQKLQFMNGVNRMLNERARRFSQTILGVLAPDGRSLYNRKV